MPIFMTIFRFDIQKLMAEGIRKADMYVSHSREECYYTVYCFEVSGFDWVRGLSISGLLSRLG